MPKKPFSGGEAHIVQRTLSRVRRDGTVNRHTHARIRSVSDHRADVRGVKHIFLVKDSVVSAAKGSPIFHRLVPVSPLRRELTAFQVGESGLVRSHETSAGSHLDRQVAECQTAFHREAADCRAGIFNKVPGGA